MATYKVNCLHLSGKGKKMFKHNDTVTTDNFYEGQAKDYLKSGHLREPDKKEKESAEKVLKAQHAENKIADKEREREVDAAEKRDQDRKISKEKEADKAQEEADKAQSEADKLTSKGKKVQDDKPGADKTEGKNSEDESSKDGDAKDESSKDDKPEGDDTKTTKK